MTDRVDLARLEIRASERILVRDVSVRLDAGAIVALVGASGSGKTLTGRALLGLVGPRPAVTRAELEIVASGQRWRPYDVAGRARERAFREVRGDVLGYLPQDARAALDPLATVGRQVAAAAALAGDRGDPRRWLERAGLPDADRVAGLHPHELSGGMAQRVVIAQAIARRSRFLVADEPTTGLDPTVQVEILAELRRLADDGAGVLFVTHDLRLLPGFADRIAIVDDGRTVETLPGSALAAARSEAGRRLLAATRRVAAGRLG